MQAVSHPIATASSAPSGRRYQVALWSLLVIGLVIRLVFTEKTKGNVFDLGSLVLVAQALAHHPSEVYKLANLPGGATPRWPYPTGYFPIVWLIHAWSTSTHAHFERLIRLPAELADLATAWVVQDHLRFRGASERRRLIAAALVMLGPSFIAISAVHGQIDPVAMLPAVIALTVWERDRNPNSLRRAWIAGLLVGLGADIKTIPVLMLLALFPSSRSRRELLTLIGAALVIPIIATIPMIVAAGTGWIHTLLQYHGGTGLGGISLIAQPSLPLNWLHVGSTPLNGADSWLGVHGGVIAGISTLAVAALLLRRRVPAELAAAAIWLTIYVLGIQFFLQYMVWGLPFFLMAGYLWQTAALQAVLFLPTLIIYHGIKHPWVAYAFYVSPMIVAWLLETGALAVVLRRVWSNQNPALDTPPPRASAPGASA